MSCKDNQNTFSLLHYNIKELTTRKLNDPNNNQVLEVQKELSKHNFDILSLNEVQYDKIGVPNEKFNTEALNIEKINSRFSLMFSKHTFAEANTGLNARKNTHGHYFEESRTSEQRSHADQVNFGVMPGQYSTGALYNFEKIDSKKISTLKWRDFDPKIDFSSYRLADGSVIPVDIPLFDKSFSDTTLKINNKNVHLILLHTVPSYGFGNKFSINYRRNEAQLSFLEWYLNHDGESKPIGGITPLNQGDYFIAVGDLNVDIKSKNPSAMQLKEIFKQHSTWIPIEDMDFTHPSPKLMLDYIILSKNIKPLEGKIIKQSSTEASDHLPIWGKFLIE